jgi:hypothetical protein
VRWGFRWANRPTRLTESLAAGVQSQDCTIKCWDAETGECIYTISDYFHGLERLALYQTAAGPHRLLTGARSHKHLQVLDAATGRLMHTVETTATAALSHLQTFVYEEGPQRTIMLVSVDDSGQCLVWEVGPAPPGEEQLRAATKLG